MNADQVPGNMQPGLLHADVTDRVLKVFYEVYNELGGRFLRAFIIRLSPRRFARLALRFQFRLLFPWCFEVAMSAILSPTLL
jgi:hypothetical protein